MSASYTRPRRKNFLKVTLIITGILFFAIFGLQVWLVHNARDVLKQIVLEKFDGNLKLELSRVRFNFFSNRLQIREADLASLDNISQPATYHVKFRKLTLRIRSFWPLHHGWANYNQNKTLDYKGTIAELVYENPHATAKIKTQKKTWTVILAPVSRMEARGVTSGMLKEGGIIRVVGYSHKKIKNEMRAERIFVNEKKYELR
jgi:hypothetical protein